MAQKKSLREQIGKKAKGYFPLQASRVFKGLFIVIQVRNRSHLEVISNLYASLIFQKVSLDFNMRICLV